MGGTQPVTPIVPARNAEAAIAPRLHRFAAFASGLVLVPLMIWALHVPASGADPGAEVRVSAVSSGELTASPAKPLVSTRDLRPSSRRAGANGSATLTNVTAERVEVAVRADSSAPELDRVLRVRLTIHGRPWYDGYLAGLRRQAVTGPGLASGRTATVRAYVWLPKSVRHGYEARRADVALHFEPREAKAR
jgi:hypothetical protein